MLSKVYSKLIGLRNNAVLSGKALTKKSAFKTIAVLMHSFLPAVNYLAPKRIYYFYLGLLLTPFKIAAIMLFEQYPFTVI